MQRSSFAFLGIAGLLAFPACERRQAPKPIPLIQRAAIAVERIIAGPPAPGGAADQEDLAEVLRYQNARTQKECERARFEGSPSLETLFGPRYNLLTRPEIDRLTPAFKRILDEIRPVVGAAKDRWNRARPSVAHPQVEPCLDKDTSASYPSGHAVLTTVYAETLATLFPERRAAISARARQACDDRILSGLHYPSDVRDGELLGKAVFAELLKSDGFRKLLDSLR